MPSFRFALWLLLVVGLFVSVEAKADECSASLPSVMLANIERTVPVQGCEQAAFKFGSQVVSVTNGQARLVLPAGESDVSLISRGVKVSSSSVLVLPGWTSILPPLLAIILAILLRNVLIALFASVWSGAFLVGGYEPLSSLARVVDHYAVKSIADDDHASILIFSLLLGGMVGVVQKSGGAGGIANWVKKRAANKRSGQVSTMLLGLLIFFDDYANSLLVGSAMRPITDRLKISREKLAFLIDATAAPVASIALISSWVGVEIGYIRDQFKGLGVEVNPYQAFLETIPYRFYPWLMLLFVAFVAWSGRDFGPMLKAENRVFEDEHEAENSENLPSASPWLALVPVASVILVAALGMYWTGRQALISDGKALVMRDIFANANSYAALIWASAFGGAIAIVMSMLGKQLSLQKAMDAWLEGTHEIVAAAMILVLAWALGYICRYELHSADYLVSLLGSDFNAALLPAIVFVLAALISFATGTSWGTMAILFPIVVPMAFHLSGGNYELMLGSVASILSGAVWGDHCSPISDTTIMSSMAARCDHIAHVRTQLPYALLVGTVALIFGEVAVGFGFYSPLVALMICAAVLGGIFFFIAKPTGQNAKNDTKA